MHPLRRFAAVSVGVVVLSLLVSAVGWRLYGHLNAEESGARTRDRRAPVGVALVQSGGIHERRAFAGTLEARVDIPVAAKVAGRLLDLQVDLGDPIERGQVIARMDDEEFVQAVAEAEAQLKVARANLKLAESRRDLAVSSSERVAELQERQIASGSQVDVAAADLAANLAQVDVARAQVARAEAALQAARIRLGYAEVTAWWPERTDHPHVVARRYVDPGATVSANDPLIDVVDVSTLRAVFFVTERDHARLAIGQQAVLATDAYTDREFEGVVRRIAPVFEETSRQIRVEVEVDNVDRALKPGMYVRLHVVLQEAEDTVIVPLAAIVRRQDRSGIFVVDESGGDEALTVSFQPVRVGIRDRDVVQLLPGGVPDLVGRKVVVLGHQLIEDGSWVRVPEVIDPDDTPLTLPETRTVILGGD